jgi:cyanophycin synthetase
MEKKISIAEIKVLRGPNYWSNYRKQLIQMKIDIGEFENFPTNKIPGFCDRLKAMFPTMIEHECSEGVRGGFFQRVNEGTWLGHVAEHIALELQSLAGMNVGYGRTRSTPEKGVYHLVFAYQIESAGIFAGKAAIRITESIALDRAYDISRDINQLEEIKMKEGLGPSTEAIIQEAKRRGIPFRRLDKNSFIQLGQGKHQKLIRSSMAGSTSVIGVDMADNKERTKNLLKEAFIPVPKGVVINSEKHVEEAIDNIGFPIVVKPMSGNHGRGIRTNIRNLKDARDAFQKASLISSNVIIEKYIVGTDFRFLLVNYKLVAVSKRIPAMIIGDGISTIAELVDKTNNDPRRGAGHEKVLTKINIEEDSLDILRQNGLTTETVLPKGQIQPLKDTANLSTGGTSRDVTHLVHPDNVFMAERIARLMNLDICGIDIIAEDISSPLGKTNGAVLEVNASPGLRMHLSPTSGMAHNVAEPIINMLYPPNSPSRIPLVAVTGTNGKTTTTRLIAHMAKKAGYTPGFTSTDGIFIDGHLVVYGDCSGPSSAGVVLRDPLVDFAVLETARGGILRSGLGFDNCDTSIITNITDDHLGLGGINTLNELAKVKAVVARSTFEHGYAILNADDDLVYAIKDELDCNIALFSLNDNNERIRAHCANDGIAAVIEKGYFTIWKGGFGQRIAKVNHVPLTLDGRAECMIQNILPAILTAFIHEFPIEQIRDALDTFIPSPKITPGRMNIFRLPHFSVMVDYAHNPDGFRQLKKFIDSTSAPSKIGIIACPGDRRDEDIRVMGSHAASMFDEIIIRHDKDLRGRTRENITELLLQGVESVGKSTKVEVISDETEALNHAMNNARENSFIVILSDEVKQTLDYLETLEKNPELIRENV